MLRLTTEEKQIIIKELLETRSERELSEEIGIPHPTIHDWKIGGRSERNGNNKEISLSQVIRIIKQFDPQSNEDFDTLIKIKEIVEKKLSKRY